MVWMEQDDGLDRCKSGPYSSLWTGNGPLAFVIFQADKWLCALAMVRKHRRPRWRDHRCVCLACLAMCTGKHNDSDLDESLNLAGESLNLVGVSLDLVSDSGG